MKRRRRVRGPLTRMETGLVATAAAIVFSRVFAFSLVLPGFREHGETLTDSDLLIGIALGAYGITMAAMQLVLGALSDRIGRRPVLVAGALVFIAGSVGAAMADSIWTLLAARLVQGLGGVSSAALAAVGETVPTERRTQAMAFIGIPAGLGFFLGFMLGPWAEPLVGMRGLFWATAVLGLLTFLPLVRPLPPPRPIETTASGIHANRRPLAALGAAGFCINFAMSVVAFFLIDAAVGRSGLALALLLALVVMGGASRALDRRQSVAIPLALAVAAVAIGAALFVLAGPLVATAGATVFFAAHATLSAALPSQVSSLSGRQGGRGHGGQLVAAYVGSAAGGAVAGALADMAEFAILVVAVVALAAGIGLAATLGRVPREAPTARAA